MLQKRKHLLATTALAAVVMAVPGAAGATNVARFPTDVLIEHNKSGEMKPVDTVLTGTLTLRADKGFTAKSAWTEADAVVVDGAGKHVIGRNSTGEAKGFNLGNVTTTKNNQGNLTLYSAPPLKFGKVGNIGTAGMRLNEVTINAAVQNAVVDGEDVHAAKLTLHAEKAYIFTLGKGSAAATSSGNAIFLGHVDADNLVVSGEGTSSIGQNDKGFSLNKVEAAKNDEGILYLYGAEGSRIGQIGEENKGLKEVWLKKGSFELAGDVRSDLHLESKTDTTLTRPTKITKLHAPSGDGTATIVVPRSVIEASKGPRLAPVMVDEVKGFSEARRIRFAPEATFVGQTVLLRSETKKLGDGFEKSYSEAADENLLTKTSYSIVNEGKDLQSNTVLRSDRDVARDLSVGTNEASALKALVNSLGDDAEARAALNGLLDSRNARAAGDVARQSTASTVSQVNQAISTASRAATDAVSSRLASARTGTNVAGLQQSGTAAGDGILRNGAWVKASGSVSSQKSRDGIAGNRTDGYGVTIGLDDMIEDDVRVGLALSTSKSDLRGKGASKTKTDVTSYQVALYGAYEPEGYFIEGQLAYAQNNVKTSRQVKIGTLDRTAKGKYNANQYSASVAVGSPLHRGAVTLTPKAGLYYTYTDPSKYTETGADALNITVDPSATSILEGSLGGSMAYEHKTKRGSVVRPEVRAAALYDFIGDDVIGVGKYSGDATLFNTSGLKRSRFGGTVGAGLGYTTADGVWEVRADYDAELRAGYVGHNGMLTGRINF